MAAATAKRGNDYYAYGYNTSNQYASGDDTAGRSGDHTWPGSLTRASLFNDMQVR